MEPANIHIAGLLNQMRFATESQKARQLDAAEKLLRLVDDTREYPLEFVCYHITGFRPKGDWAQDTIKGKQLAGDLQVFITRLSELVCGDVREVAGAVYSINDLAKKLGVATKTINRWRNRGLVPRKYLFEDGKKRLGFSEECWAEFERVNADLVARAKDFTQMRPEETQQIIAAARSIAAEGVKGRRAAIDEIAKHMGRARETVRYTLAHYEQKNAVRIFAREQTKLGPRDCGAVYKAYISGASSAELMKKFSKSRTAIYRIINQRRMKELLGQKIEFIASDEFEKMAAQGIDAEKINEFDRYLSEVSTTFALTRQQEIEFFKRYNFLKFCSRRQCDAMVAKKWHSDDLKKLEALMSQAGRIQKFLIEANQGLVVSIANKHSQAGTSMPDLVSEGNLSLMRAVEKFDYNRGYRFSTYATWAIAKDFARKVGPQAARIENALSDELENVQRNLRISETGTAGLEKAKRSLEQIIKENLDEREQYIIRQHFALSDSVIRKKGASLKQIGDELDISKERVRQIELEALAKLRHCLSEEEFEMLTG